MRRELLLIPIFISVFSTMLSCGPITTQKADIPSLGASQINKPAMPVTQEPTSVQNWAKTIEGAKKEGRLVIISTAGDSFRSGLIPVFKEKFGIDVEVITGKGAEVSQKLTSEQRAGIYLADVYVGGTTTQVTQLKPAGILVPIDPYLILPEVLDGKGWLDGKLPWIDKEHIILASALYPNQSLGINTKQVKPGEITSYLDLLNPKWKGKIVLNDPTMSGVGGKWAVIVGTVIMNWDYLRKIAKQEPVIITDQRIQVEWLAKGKYPISIVPKTEIFNDFKEAGAPIKGGDLEEGTWLATGSSGVSVVKKHPHTNAARLFVNWILTREGQEFFSRALGVQSARVDVPTDFLDPLLVRQTGVKYFNTATEEFLLLEPEHRKTVVEIFSPLVR